MSPTINVVTLGHADAGKTTLAAALCRLASKSGKAQLLSYSNIKKSPAGTVIKYSTSEYEYSHAYYPDLETCAKALRAGEFKADIAILVMSAIESVELQTEDSVALAKDVGIKHIVGAMNKSDIVNDPEILDLYEVSARELLSDSGFQGNDLPFVRTSALRALQGDDRWEKTIGELLKMLDGATV